MIQYLKQHWFIATFFSISLIVSLLAAMHDFSQNNYLNGVSKIVIGVTFLVLAFQLNNERKIHS